MTERGRFFSSGRDASGERREHSGHDADGSGSEGVDEEFEGLLSSLSEAMESRNNGSAHSGPPVEPQNDREASETDVVPPDEGFVPFYPTWLNSSAEGCPADAASGAGEQAPADGSPEDEAVASAWRELPRRRHVYRSHESSRLPPHGFRCQVRLASQGREHVGEAEGAAVPGVRADIAARATLDAVVKAEGKKVVLSLMAARVLRFVDLPVVIVAVYALNEEEVKRLVGGAIVENSEEQAAILATLQAVDRWVTGAVARLS